MTDPQALAPRRWQRVRSIRLSRRATAKSMIGVGVIGIVTAIVGLIVGEVLISQVESSVDDSLVLTNEALNSVDDSITVTASIVDTVRTGTESVRTTMKTVQASLDDASTAISDSAEFMGGSLPDALDAVSDVLPTIERAASAIDDALRVVSRAPFGPDYNPDEPFDKSIADLSTAIEPLTVELRALSVGFDDLTSSTSSMSQELTQVGLDVADLQTQLDDVATLLDRYTSTMANAKVLAARSRDDLAQSASLSRWLLVLLAVVFAAGQIVPIWLGLLLLRDSNATTILVPEQIDES